VESFYSSAKASFFDLYRTQWRWMRDVSFELLSALVYNRKLQLTPAVLELGRLSFLFNNIDVTSSEILRAMFSHRILRSSSWPRFLIS
jgi:hypothetical protein